MNEDATKLAGVALIGGLVGLFAWLFRRAPGAPVNPEPAAPVTASPVPAVPAVPVIPAPVVPVVRVTPAPVIPAPVALEHSTARDQVSNHGR